MSESKSDKMYYWQRQHVRKQVRYNVLLAATVGPVECIMVSDGYDRMYYCQQFALQNVSLGVTGLTVSCWQ